MFRSEPTHRPFSLDFTTRDDPGHDGPFRHFTGKWSFESLNIGCLPNKTLGRAITPLLEASKTNASIAVLNKFTEAERLLASSKLSLQLFSLSEEKFLEAPKFKSDPCDAQTV